MCVPVDYMDEDGSADSDDEDVGVKEPAAEEKKQEEDPPSFCPGE